MCHWRRGPICRLSTCVRERTLCSYKQMVKSLWLLQRWDVWVEPVIDHSLITAAKIDWEDHNCQQRLLQDWVPIQLQSLLIGFHPMPTWWNFAECKDVLKISTHLLNVLNVCAASTIPRVTPVTFKLPSFCWFCGSETFKRLNHSHLTFYQCVHSTHTACE